MTMNKMLFKILFFWQKPEIAVLTSGNLELTRNFIARILDRPYLLERKVLICSYNLQKQLSLGRKKYLILNYDDDNIRKIKEYDKAKIITFGFRADADFRASDVKINGGVNFKINYQGNTVPVWLEKPFGQEHIQAALAAAAVGEVLGLNLIDVSEALR